MTAEPRVLPARIVDAGVGDNLRAGKLARLLRRLSP
jgi:hypothetical protein